MSIPATPGSHASQGCIGILAGSGQFPFLVARGAKKNGLRVVVCGFLDNTDSALAAEADAFIMLGLGQLGALIDFFKQHGVQKACMAGAIHKPSAMNLKPDLRAAKLLFKLAANKGDDALLRAVAGELRCEGIELVQPEELAPELRSPSGILGSKQPNAGDWIDIRFGWDIAKAVGALDIGQCVVVRGGIVVAVEGIEGTNVVLARGGELGGPGCTAVKIVKPGQDERLDLPSIGAKTFELLARYKYAGIAFAAGKTLFFDQKVSLGLAREHNILVVGVPEDAESFFTAHTRPDPV